MSNAIIRTLQNLHKLQHLQKFANTFHISHFVLLYTLISVEYILISCSHKAHSFPFRTKSFVYILILQMHATSQVHLIILDLTGLIILREQHKLQGQFYFFLPPTVWVHMFSALSSYTLSTCVLLATICALLSHWKKFQTAKRKLADLPGLNDLTCTVSRNCTASSIQIL